MGLFERDMIRAGLGGLTRAASSLVAGILYPPSCMGCGIFLQQPGALCARCWPTLHFIEAPICPVLGLPFSYAVEEGTVSPAAMADPPAFSRARAAVLYDDVASAMVHRLKYGDRAELALPMARWMQRAGAELLAECDMIVAVPLHRRRLMKRRYNQSAELARALSALSGVPQASGSLIRRKATLQQVGLGQKARERNVRGAFALGKDGAAAFAGRRVLLIDDVYTTGATVNAAARALNRAGAADVSVLTFARVATPAEDG